ncbi:hypothetical protein [Eleftheria terrae]|uniref:hypothetical protein n=1 Tax=Eleftheria terrae TaxID=1597781 RepID=UPI00263AEC1E|nr:hypothetical protein [Eleftheria terrae]WKB55564.1 hypothetical protein N7L95_26180 [Eleftheria terrae]
MEHLWHEGPEWAKALGRRHDLAWIGARGAEAQPRPAGTLHPFTVVLRAPVSPTQYETVVAYAHDWQVAVRFALDGRQHHDVCAVFRGSQDDVWNP